MTVWFKRVLVGLVALAIVALVGIAIFLLTFDPNAYKDKVRDLVFERYQRTLVINGDIELSLFPRIGLTVQDASLSQRNSDTVFASFDSARVAVAIWPLLSNNLVVDHVSISGFNAWIERADDGSLNLQDLLSGGASDTLVLAAAGVADAVEAVPDETQQETPQETPPETPRSSVLGGLQVGGVGEMHVDIAGLDLRQGAIHMLDQRSGLALDLVDLDIKTGRITSNQAFDVVLKGRIQGEEPRADASVDGQALLQFDPERKTYSAQRLSVQLAGRLPGFDAKQVSLRGNLGYSAYSQTLNVSSLELQAAGQLDGEQPVKDFSASLLVPQLDFNRSQMDLQLEKLALRMRGALQEDTFELAIDAPKLMMAPQSAAGDAVTGMFKLEGSQKLGLNMSFGGIAGTALQPAAREFRVEGQLQQGKRLTRLNLSSPVQWNILQRSGGLSAMKGDLRIDDERLEGGSFEFPMIGSVAVDLIKDQLRADINAVLDGSKVDFRLQATELDVPRSTFTLSADVLNLNPFLGGAETAEAPAKADKAEAKEISKEQSAPEAAEPQGAEAEPVAPKALSFPFLDTMDVKGELNIGELHWRDLLLSDVKAKMKAAEGKFQISNVSANLYDGTFKGEFSLASDAGIRSKGVLDQVNMEALSQAATGSSPLSGKAGLTYDLKASVANPQNWVETLGGTAQLKVREGAFKGLNVMQALRGISEAIRTSFSAPIELPAGAAQAGSRTPFTALDGTLTLDKGVATVKSLNATAPYLRIRQGKQASISLPERTLDVALNITVVNTGSGQEGQDLRALQGVTVPVRLHGPLSSPDYDIQWKAIGNKVVQNAVKKGLLDVVREALPAAPAADAAEPADPSDDKEDADSGVETVRAIGQAIKGLLH